MLKSIFCKYVSTITRFPSVRRLSANSSKYAVLDHRSIIKVEGRDAVEFMQGMVTNDVTMLSDMKCMYAMLLNQHGRVLNDVILYHNPDSEESSIFLECEKDSVESLVKTLKLYKLRKKLKISLPDYLTVAHSFDMSSPGSETGSTDGCTIITTAADPRTNSFGSRLIIKDFEKGDLGNDSGIDQYHATRINIGIPEGHKDLTPTKALPLESNLDYMNGVSFHKGCYIGQELTARTKFTGVIRKRLLPVDIAGSEPVHPDTSIYTARGKNAGKIRSTMDNTLGLALVRLNFANEKLVTKEGHEVTCRIPSWWPSKDGTEFSDGVCGPNFEPK